MDLFEKFKYGKEIKEVIKEFNIQLRDDLEPPNNKKTCRFVHDGEHKDNHKPVYTINPKRFLQPTDRSKVTCNGFALSCFPSVNEAEGFFNKKKKNFKNFKKLIGNNICSGDLNNEDGLISKEEKENFNHFELFEYKGCNLSEKFGIVKNII